MSRYQKIYTDHALEYDQLVSKEDFAGNILRAIESICDLEGRKVVEFGAGTGRLTALLAPKAKSIEAFDAYPAMLALADSKFRETGIKNVVFSVGENKNLPVHDAAFELAIAGWTFGHCVSWFPDTWKEEIGAAVMEMLRVIAPGGTALILETLGTGQTSPSPPNERLAAYYAYLEKECGFTRISIRTDYKFGSLEEGQALTKAFFGRDYEFSVEPSGAAILPECTGIWHRKK